MQNEKPKKTKSALKIALVSVGVISVGILLFFAILSQNGKETVSINSATVNIEIASSLQEKTKGLCCRDYLDENAGMLFVYSAPGDYRFWMKDTRIPLDMIWISSEKRVVHIEKSLQPSSYPQRFGSSVPSQYILETNAGWADKNNISIGDIAHFNF